MKRISILLMVSLFLGGCASYRKGLVDEPPTMPERKTPLTLSIDVTSTVGTSYNSIHEEIWRKQLNSAFQEIGYFSKINPEVPDIRVQAEVDKKVTGMPTVIPFILSVGLIPGHRKAKHTVRANIIEPGQGIIGTVKSEEFMETYSGWFIIPATFNANTESEMQEIVRNKLSRSIAIKTANLVDSKNPTD